MLIEIDDNTLIRRNDTPIAADMGDELIMMSIERGNYYGLGEVGSRIWQLLESPLDLRSLLARLQDEYDVDPATCRRDVMNYLSQLQQEGLVRFEHGLGRGLEHGTPA